MCRRFLMVKLRTKSDIVAALRARNIHLKKSLGQHFLIDHNLLDFIVRSADVTKADIVLEIGGGSGLLTRRLADAAAHVVTVEIDEQLAALCRDHTADLGNITLLTCDALESKTALNPDVERAVRGAMESHEAARLKVVANLSYAVSTRVIQALLEGPLPVELMVVTVQKEVSGKLAAQPGTREYRPLSVIVQAHARVEELRELKPAVFFPQPKISSAIIRLTPTDETMRRILNYETFTELVKGLFLHRRKKATGALALAEYFEMPREALSAALENAGVSDDTRADKLSVEEIVRLANELWMRLRPTP